MRDTRVSTYQSKNFYSNDLLKLINSLKRNFILCLLHVIDELIYSLIPSKEEKEKNNKKQNFCHKTTDD